MVRGTFQLIPEDYQQGCLAWRNLKAWRRWLLRCSYFLMSLTIPVAVLLADTRPDPQTLKISAAIFALAALCFTYKWAAPRFSARRQFRANLSAQSPITIEASDAGLALHSAYAESKVSWSAYVAWAEAKSVL
jgi:hypothetical protein